MVLGYYDDAMTLTGATVEYAGSNGDAAVWAYYSAPSFDGCAITDSAADGMWAEHATVDFTGGALDGNAGHGLRADASTLAVAGSTLDGNGGSGLSAASSDVAITGSSASGNAGDGVALDADSELDPAVTPSFELNTMTANGGHPLVLPAGSAGDLDAASVLAPNGIDAIHVLGGTVIRSGTWHDFGVPWLVDGDVDVQHSSSPVVTIADGNELRFTAGHYFRVGWNSWGGLVVQGTSSGVLFTSDAPTPAAGDWVGVVLGYYDDAMALTGATIEYGGAPGGGAAGDANLVFYYADGTVTDCTIQHSAGWGIYRQNSTPTLTNVTYTDNALGDLF